MNEQDTVVRLPVFDAVGETRIKKGTEVLPVEQLGANHFKLKNSPGFVECLAAGDEFELSDTEPLGYKLLRHSGNLCVWYYFNETKDTKGAEAKQLQEEVETLGGWLDGGLKFMLIFTIPFSAGFAKIDEVFNQAQNRIFNSGWEYGNVYDTKDGVTLLNWW